jgi:DNA-binding IclR family transcriptional regulator
MQDQPRRTAAPRVSRSAPVRAYGTLNTLRALEQLALGPLSAPELAARTRIGARTARRLLQRLALEGYATRGDWHHRRYAATLRLAALGRQLVEETALIPMAAPSLLALVAAAPGQASLWIPGAGGAIRVLHVEDRDATPRPMLGDLALTGDHAAVRALAAGDARIHAHGCAAPTDPGVLEIAAPVHDDGQAVAAVSFTAQRPAGTAPDALAIRVVAAARTISAVVRDGVL